MEQKYQCDQKKVVLQMQVVVLQNNYDLYELYVCLYEVRKLNWKVIAERCIRNRSRKDNRSLVNIG